MCHYSRGGPVVEPSQKDWEWIPLRQWQRKSMVGYTYPPTLDSQEKLILLSCTTLYMYMSPHPHVLAKEGPCFWMSVPLSEFLCHHSVITGRLITWASNSTSTPNIIVTLPSSHIEYQPAHVQYRYMA
jgi:hypothetical protein